MRWRNAGGSTEEYEKMLEGIYQNFPKKDVKQERFEIPDVESHLEGNKTIIKNFGMICEKIRRKKMVVAKFFSKELAAPISLTDTRLVIQRKTSQQQLKKTLEDFVNMYIICKECKRPDTNIVEIGHGLRMMVCEACGMRSPVR